MNSRLALGALVVLLLLGLLVRPGGVAPHGPAAVMRSSASVRLPEGVWAGELYLGGLELEDARAALTRFAQEMSRRPLWLELEGEQFSLDPAQVGYSLDVEGTLAAVASASRDALLPGAIYLPLSAEEPGDATLAAPRRIAVPIRPTVDERAVRAALEGVAAHWDVPSLPLRLAQLTDTRSLASGTIPVALEREGGPLPVFLAPRAGRRLDVEGSVPLVVRALQEGDRRPLVLPVQVVPAPRPDPRLLSEALRKEAEGAPGVVGAYVRDLRTGQEVGWNADVVFSGASVVKIAIMVLTYAAVDGPPASRVAWDLGEMMIYSDNDAANRLLALAGEGDPVRGSYEMTALLRTLGLEHSFLCSPYGDPGSGWCSNQPLSEQQAASDPLRADPDPDLQTTPREMGLLLEAIYRCAQGTGPLLERLPQKVEPGECRDMLALMRENADRDRLVAGLPPDVEVAHKSGWIPDMKADAGIVYGPSGAYVASIFVWKGGELSDEEGNRWIARLSWLIYSFFNPLETVPGPVEDASAPGTPGG